MARRWQYFSIIVLLFLISGAIYETSPQTHQSPVRAAGGDPPNGRRVGFWVADDDVFSTTSPYGSSPSASTFFNDYFLSPPYPATMLWVSGLVSSGSASVPSDQEATWLGQVASLADSHPNIIILMLFFVNLAGTSVITFTNAHSSCFTAGRTGNQGQSIFSGCGLTPNTLYTIGLQDPNKNPVATIGAVTTNSTGGFSSVFPIPNEPQNNGLWYIVVQGTALYWQGSLQSDQTQQLTSYVNILKGHPSIYGALFEPEYFGDTLAIQAAFRSIIVGAGYQNLVGQAGSSDPILAYSSYPYFGGAIQSASQTNQIGIHYGETGGPLCDAQNPCPIWTQPTVQSIVEKSAPLPCTIIISEDDTNNPIGNSLLWANPTLRGWIADDPYYKANYLTSQPTGPVPSTTASSTQSSSAAGGSQGGVDISFSSYSIPFHYGQNFRTTGSSFLVQVPRPVETNMIAFYLSDRGYDPNPVPFTLSDPSGAVIANGTIPALLRFASQQYYPIQLSKVVTLQAGLNYTVRFASLPSGDDYGSSGVSQDILQEAEASPGTGYLGQAQWPIFELGLMNILTQGEGLAYHNYGSYTDLFSSPGYQSTGEIAMRFQASQAENLQSFEFFVWSSDGSSNQLTFSLRPDSGGFPAGASSSLASSSLAASQAAAGTFATVTFPTSPQLTAGSYYWLVATSASGHQPIIFGRLVNPYREYVLYSNNEQTWSVPPDGPTDLGFRITTTGESIINTVSGSSSNDYFTGIAQSFIPSSTSQVKGAWVDAKPSGQDLIVSIQTDSGSDKPSGSVVANGSSAVASQFTGGPQAFVYVGFSSSATLTVETKYWLVVTVGPCPSVCSNPASAATLQYRSDYFGTAFAPPSGLHYETQQGSTWVSPGAAGTMNFALVAPTGNENDPIWATSSTTTARGSTQGQTTSASSAPGTSVSVSTSQEGSTSGGLDALTSSILSLLAVAAVGTFGVLYLKRRRR